VRTELESVRARQLMGQYIILEDRLIAGVDKFEGMILRPSDKAKLAGLVEELDRLTKQYQEEWEDDYWETYNLQRGIFTENSAPVSSKQRRNRLSLKLESFKKSELRNYAKASTIDPSFHSSEIEKPKSNISPPVIATLSVVDQRKAPANSKVSVKEPVVSSLPPKAVPTAHLVGQDSSVVVRKEHKEKSPTKVRKESGTACCAKCNVM
jgi:hypothetical protein